MLIPLVDIKGVPLAPCNHTRYKTMVRQGKVTPFLKKGILAGRLNKEVAHPELKTCVVGIDPGSKRTGLTVVYSGKVVLNVQCNAPDWIKKKMEDRKSGRKNRRYRKTPYRKPRFNRSVGCIPPSTKARWQAHIRIIRILAKILPISEIVIEEIKAVSKKGRRKWNCNFSPLQTGKRWFDENAGLPVSKYKGYETFRHRKYRRFKKSSKKLAETWSAHCIDSHSLCELHLKTTIPPFRSLYILKLFRFNRRILHHGYKTGGIRQKYGSTKSQSYNRGSVLRHQKYDICYLGGTSKIKGRKWKVSVSNSEGKRLSQTVDIKDCKILTNNSWTTRFKQAV